MIHTQHLFAPLDEKLIELLHSLNNDDWNKKTIAGNWTVKDVAAHLLDTSIRTLSFGRDGYNVVPDREINSYQTLVDYLNHLNKEWVSASRRLSPPVLIQMIEIMGRQQSEYYSQLDPHIDAPFPVSWAGESVSKNWFHIAREYTERWHHQQQIRDAVGKDGIMTRELFYPMIDTFMRGLPHTYRDTHAANGTMIKITITTPVGGNWFLIRDTNSWQLSNNEHNDYHAQISIPPDAAWKLFTKGLKPAQAMELVIISGDEELVKPVLKMIAIMG